MKCTVQMYLSGLSLISVFLMEPCDLGKMFYCRSNVKFQGNKLCEPLPSIGMDFFWMVYHNENFFQKTFHKAYIK